MPVRSSRPSAGKPIQSSPPYREFFRRRRHRNRWSRNPDRDARQESLGGNACAAGYRRPRRKRAHLPNDARVEAAVERRVVARVVGLRANAASEIAARAGDKAALIAVAAVHVDRSRAGTEALMAIAAVATRAAVAHGAGEDRDREERKPRARTPARPMPKPRAVGVLQTTRAATTRDVRAINPRAIARAILGNEPRRQTGRIVRARFAPTQIRSSSHRHEPRRWRRRRLQEPSRYRVRRRRRLNRRRLIQRPLLRELRPRPWRRSSRLRRQGLAKAAAWTNTQPNGTWRSQGRSRSTVTVGAYPDSLASVVG